MQGPNIVRNHSMSAALSIDAVADLDPQTARFYRDVLEVLTAARVPFIVGGAYAFIAYTGVERPTKDLDLFIRRQDYERASQALTGAGYETVLSYPHWLGKVRARDEYVDLIFSSGNGVATVDDGWFQHAVRGRVMGVDVLLSPVEEMVWSKAFVMERERHDGADVAHLLRACAPQLDWPRMLSRFGRHWRVLLSHLILYGFIYPAERSWIPTWVMEDLLARLKQELHSPAPEAKLCGGTLLSREQYLADIEQKGYEDGRVRPFGNMTRDDVADWTSAIPDRQQ